MVVGGLEDEVVLGEGLYEIVLLVCICVCLLDFFFFIVFVFLWFFVVW